MNKNSKIVPSIRYNDCEKAIEWLCTAFSFKKHLIVPSEAGGILHAQLVYKDCMVMLGKAHEGDEFGKLNSSPLELDGQNTASIFLVVDELSNSNHFRRKVHAPHLITDLRKFSCDYPVTTAKIEQCVGFA